MASEMSFKVFDTTAHPVSDISSVYDWDVVLGAQDAPHVVFEAKGYAHSWGDGPFELYAAPRDSTRIEGRRIVEVAQAHPWWRRDWNMWGVETSFGSYLKTKYRDTSWRSTLCAYVTRNKARLLQVFAGDVAMAAAQALALIPRLAEHPLNLMTFEWEKRAIGRQIRVNGAYATIARVDTKARFNDQLFVVPSDSDRFPPPPGWDVPGEEICNPEHWRDDYAAGFWTELLNPAIDWFPARRKQSESRQLETP